VIAYRQEVIPQKTQTFENAREEWAVPSFAPALAYPGFSRGKGKQSIAHETNTNATAKGIFIVKLSSNGRVEEG